MAKYMTISAPPASKANMELADLAALQGFLGVTQDATRMGLVVDGVNAQIYHFLRNRLVLDSAVDYVQIIDGPRDGRHLRLPVLPVQSITALERGYYNTGGWVTEHTYLASEYVLDIEPGTLFATPTAWWPTGEKTIKATYQAGFATVPAGLKMAVLEIMAVEYNRISGKRIDTITVGHDAGSTSYTFDTWPLTARREVEPYVRKDGLI